MKTIEHRGELFELYECPITMGSIHALSIRIVHEATRRVKSGTTTLPPTTLIRSLLEDICSDLDDVARGNIPPEAGRFDP